MRAWDRRRSRQFELTMRLARLMTKTMLLKTYFAAGLALATSFAIVACAEPRATPSAPVDTSKADSAPSSAMLEEGGAMHREPVDRGGSLSNADILKLQRMVNERARVE